MAAMMVQLMESPMHIKKPRMNSINGVRLNFRRNKRKKWKCINKLLPFREAITIDRMPSPSIRRGQIKQAGSLESFSLPFMKKRYESRIVVP